MANSYINVYKNNPTAGGTDGTAISTNGNFTAPLNFTLDASIGESAVQKCAIRTEAGYTTSGTTTITDYNDTNDRLKLCWTENGTFADSISTANAITDENTIFYVQAGSSTAESPTTDRGISIKVSCVVAAV